MKKLIFPALILLSLSFTLTQQSCVGSRVVLNATYDSSIVIKVQALKDMTAALFSQIQTSPDKSFETYRPEYTSIRNDLDSVVKIESKRTKGGPTEYQSQATLAMFDECINGHKKYGNLVNTQVAVYARYMNDIYAIWLKTEKQLKK